MTTDHSPGKPGTVRDFDSCQGNVWELIKGQENVAEVSGKKACQGELFIANFKFGATPVFSRL